MTLGVLYLVRDYAGAFILGALLAFLINPAVDRLVALKIPRVLAILVMFAVVLAGVAAVTTMIVPVLVQETHDLRAQAPGLATIAQARLSQLEGHPLTALGLRVDLTRTTRSIEQNANGFLLGQFGTALSFGLAALTTLLQVLLMFIVAFLIALDAHRLSTFIRRLVPTDYRLDFDVVWAQTKSMLYSYIRGQLVIAGLIGVLIGIAIWLLGLKFALALGLIAGITSLVPYLGPVIGAIPAVLVGLAASPQQALIVGIAYLVISNIILNFVYPKVMGNAVRLPPLAVIIAFIAGFSLGGILGMFIAVPVAATIRILYDYLHPRVYGD